MVHEREYLAVFQHALPSYNVAMLKLQVDDSIELRLLEERHDADLFTLTDANRRYLREWLPWLDTVKSVADTKKFRKQ